MSFESPETPEQARLLVERVEDLVGGRASARRRRSPMIAGSTEPDTRPHHHALERREAHRRVDALAVADGGAGAAVPEVGGDDGVVGGGRARTASRPAAPRSGGSCRGSRSAAPGASRATRTAPGRCTRAPASSGGRRCRTRPPAAGSGRAPARPGCRGGSAGCAAGRAGCTPSTLAITSGVIAIEPENLEPPWTTRCPTPTEIVGEPPLMQERHDCAERGVVSGAGDGPRLLRAVRLPVEGGVGGAEALGDAGDELLAGRGDR